MGRKVIAFWLILVMVLGCIVFVDEIVPKTHADTITVDDSGGANFFTIQDGVNAAKPGDTVFVYSGTYYENVIVNKSINLTGEDRDTTIIDASGSGDVVHINVNWTNITGLTVKGGGAAVGNAGIKLFYAQNCSAVDIRAYNNKYGFFLWYANDNNLTMNDVSGNIQGGICIIHSSRNNITKNLADDTGDAIKLVTLSNDNNIIENVASNNYMGITVDYSRGNIITRNNATSNSNQGIFLYTNSRGNTITDNNMTNNGFGIEIRDSGGNNITRNTISNNGWGIYLRDSKWINITDNNMTNNGIFINGDSIDLWNTHDIKTSNTINGKPVYYWKDKTGGVIPSNASQVILANCTEIEVEGLELNYASVGIEMGFSLNNNVTGNTASDNYYGIFIKNSDDNNITYNNASSNVYGLYFYLSDMNNITGNSASLNILDGIYFYQSNRGNISSNIIASNERFGFNIDYSKWNNITCNNIYLNHDCGLDLSLSAESNKIYHNNFFDNTNHASDPTDNKNQWDDGYPSGGNYWSDYGGEDHYMGINQNIHGRDGIGDMNYTIDSDSIDRYPLMGLFPLFPTANYTTLKQGWNLISIPLIQANTSLSSVLQSIQSEYDAVQWYDNSGRNYPWKHNKVSKPFGNDLSEVNESMGFWIHITNPGDTIFLYNGTQPSSNQSITLHPGWNMIGYPSLTNRNRTEGLNNLTFDDQVDAIWSYDAATQKWEEMGELDYFQIGRGYYIHAKSECEWEVPL